MRHCPSGMPLPTLEVTAPETGEILSNLDFNTHSSLGLPRDHSTHELRFGGSILQVGRVATHDALCSDLYCFSVPALLVSICRIAVVAHLGSRGFENTQACSDDSASCSVAISATVAASL
jgi:hypothetical protein